MALGMRRCTPQATGRLAGHWRAGRHGRLVEPTDLPLHQPIGLMLRPVGEGVDDPLPLAKLL